MLDAQTTESQATIEKQPTQQPVAEHAIASSLPEERGLCQLGEMLMARAKLKTLREMSNDDLFRKINGSRTNLSKIRSEGAKGTLKKQTGSVKYVRRDVARILTILNERKITL